MGWREADLATEARSRGLKVIGYTQERFFVFAPRVNKQTILQKHVAGCARTTTAAYRLDAKAGIAQHLHEHIFGMHHELVSRSRTIERDNFHARNSCRALGVYGEASARTS